MNTKNIVFTKPYVAEYLDGELPDEIGPDKVLVRTVISTVSPGTERAVITDSPNAGGFREHVFPRRSGYSSAGYVEKAGGNVKSVKPGDRVIVFWGTHAEYNLVPEDGTKFKVDGDLTEWTEQKLASKTLQGEGDTAGKSVTFYGAMTTTGLYMACDVYHDIYVTGQTPGSKNTSALMTVYGSANRIRIYATGLDSNGAFETAGVQLSELVIKTDEINDATKYHTIFEIFIANDSLPEFSMFQNTINVGIGLSMQGDKITGSEYAGEDGYSDSWGIPGYAASDCTMVATPTGLYGFDEYFVQAE